MRHALAWNLVGPLVQAACRRHRVDVVHPESDLEVRQRQITAFESFALDERVLPDEELELGLSFDELDDDGLPELDDDDVLLVDPALAFAASRSASAFSRCFRSSSVVPLDDDLPSRLLLDERDSAPDGELEEALALVEGPEASLVLLSSCERIWSENNKSSPNARTRFTDHQPAVWSATHGN
ncbi:hypothetical protein VNO80_33233 [Phaseolus coccineus]|uniref:Uncharacterized protein n=1 Tax=Phaseolus coccineus TaxID=3886 RepID=A0AAN9L1R4_PHACN